MNTSTEEIKDTQAEDDAIAEAAMLAELSGVDETAPAEEIKQLAPDIEDAGTETVAEGPAATDEPEEEVSEPERKEIFKGYTEDELTNALGSISKLQRALDTTNGTYGHKLAKLEEAIGGLTQKQQTALTNLTPGKLSRLEKEFPGIAELLSEDLNDWVAPAGADAKVSVDIDAKMDDRFNAFDKRIKDREVQIEARMLTTQHPDWRELAAYTPTANGLVMWNNPDFGAWVARQDRDIQSALLTADDATFLAEQISRYKNVVPANIAPKSKSKAILDNAVAPRGVSASIAKAKSDDQIAHEAFLLEYSS
tara:strand:+ start:2586 stop:3512 length:927 start_codon:yes stop_codon:yes gene_type:complete